MKKFIISESEKNNIRRMYGLIKEEEGVPCEWKNWTNGDGISKPKIDVTKTTSEVTVTFEGPETGFCIQHLSGSTGDTIHQTAGVTRIVVGDYLKQLYNSGIYVYPNLDGITMTKNVNYFSITVPFVQTTEDKAIMNFNERGGWGHNGEGPLSAFLTTIQNKPQEYINIKVVQKTASGGKSTYITENWVSFRNIKTFPIKTNSNQTSQTNQKQPVIITKQKPNEKKTQQTTVNNNQQSKPTNGKTSVEEDKEITDYLDYYLKNNTCDDIAEDLEEFKSSPAYKKLSSDEQKQLNQGITGLKNPGMAVTFGGIPCDKGTPKCDCIKNYMKEELVKKLQTDRDKVIVQTCEFAKKFPPQTPLTVCSPKINTGNNTNTNTGTNTTINTGNNTNTGTNTKTDEPEVINTKPKTNEPVIINSKSKTNEPVIINTKSKTNTSTPTTSETNYTLDTPQKIQEFQIWMDDNYGKWAYSRKYNKNYKVNRNPKLGFGRLGPNTNKYWNTDSYRNDYLKEKGLIQ